MERSLSHHSPRSPQPRSVASSALKLPFLFGTSVFFGASSLLHCQLPEVVARVSFDGCASFEETHQCLPQHTSALAPCSTNGRFGCLWVVPHRFRCLAYFLSLISFPHFGHIGTKQNGRPPIIAPPTYQGGQTPRQCAPRDLPNLLGDSIRSMGRSNPRSFTSFVLTGS